MQQQLFRAGDPTGCNWQRAMEAKVVQLERQVQELINQTHASASAQQVLRTEAAAHLQRTVALESALALAGATGGGQRSDLVDKRLLAKPSTFNGSQDKWSDWAFVLRAYIGAIDPKLKRDMDKAAAADVEIRASDLTEEEQARSSSLYYVLVLLSRTRP